MHAMATLCIFMYPSPSMALAIILKKTFTHIKEHKKERGTIRRWQSHRRSYNGNGLFQPSNLKGQFSDLYFKVLWEGVKIILLISFHRGIRNQKF